MTGLAPVARIDGLAKTRRDSERSFTLTLPRLHLAPGDRLALVGASGSGKSTLIGLLALATSPDRAERFDFWASEGNRLDAAAAWRSSDERRLTDARARAIAYIPQRDGLMEFLTVAGNIRAAAELAGAGTGLDLAGIVDALGLGTLLSARPARISGGQRQRVAVACALARRPRLILADEPTAALDTENATRVMSSLCRLATEQGAAIVLATHQLALAAEYGFSVLRAESSRIGDEWATIFLPA